MSSPVKNVDDGMPFVSPTLELRFAEDQRVNEVARMFSSANPVKIMVEKRDSMTDAEHVDQQELMLFNKTKRTMAIPIGRALFTYGMLHCSL